MSLQMPLVFDLGELRNKVSNSVSYMKCQLEHRLVQFIILGQYFVKV